MSKALLTIALLSSTLIVPVSARADAMDDFRITGNGEVITFTLPASPPGNLSTCPPTSPSCLPGSQTDFSVSTLVTINGVSAVESIDFPTFRFGDGLSIGLDPGRLFGGQQLFTPDAAHPTFLIGTFDLSQISPKGDPPIIDYTLVISPDVSTAPAPEPSTVALLTTGILGLAVKARRRTVRD